MAKQLDRFADRFELYLTRNIFKVPSSPAADVRLYSGRGGRQSRVDCFGAILGVQGPMGNLSSSGTYMHTHIFPSLQENAMDVDKKALAAEMEEDEGSTIPLPASAGEVGTLPANKSGIWVNHSADSSAL